MIDTELKMIKKENEYLKNQIETLDRENQLLKTIFDSIHEGVYVTNQKGEIILYNSKAEKSEGMKRADVLGKKETDVYSFISENNFHEAVTAKVIKTSKPLIEYHYKFNLPNGRRKDMLLNSYLSYEPLLAFSLLVEMSVA